MIKCKYIDNWVRRKWQEVHAMKIGIECQRWKATLSLLTGDSGNGDHDEWLLQTDVSVELTEDWVWVVEKGEAHVTFTLGRTQNND